MDSSESPSPISTDRSALAPPHDPVLRDLPPRSGPRWWTPILVCGVSLGVFLFASVVMAVVAMLYVHGTLSQEILKDPDKVAAISRSRFGLLLMVVVPQFALVATPIIAAYLSPEPFLRRLGLVRGHWPIWAWLAAAAATPFVGLFSSTFVGIWMEDSETLREMTKIFREHGANGFLLPLALMIGATPAICEELLFRGYVQTRLTRSFGPLLGIFFSSFLFAAFHLDLVHVVAVFPLGLYLGWVSWRSGSLLPAMLGHFVNNVISVVAAVMAPEEEPEVLGWPILVVSLGILGIGFLGAVGTVVASIAYGRPQEPPLRIETVADLDSEAVLDSPNPKQLV